MSASMTYQNETEREAAILAEQEQAEGEALAEALKELRAAHECLKDAEDAAQEGRMMVAAAIKRLDPTPHVLPMGAPTREETDDYAARMRTPGRIFVR